MRTVEPPHAVEDMPWAEVRLGPERVKGAYAWRTMRRVGVRLVFSSDLVGSDHNIYYGLHSAITRRDKTLTPDGGWYADQRMTLEGGAARLRDLGRLCGICRERPRHPRGGAPGRPDGDGRRSAGAGRERA